MKNKTRYKCNECDHISTTYLTAPNPFDEGDTIFGCEECKSVITLTLACRIDGCKREASNGMPKKDGEYVWSCFEHSPEKLGD